MTELASGPGHQPGEVSPEIAEMLAPAKLTLSLTVTGVRPDGYHELDSEMVTLDLADTLVIGAGKGLTIEPGTTSSDGRGQGEPEVSGAGVPGLSAGADNLVVRALEAVGGSARVRLIKRIPVGAGLGGGSADAAAILRWAGCTDLEVAAALGADVPFCVAGGRARVRGIGESVTALTHEDREFTLLLPPFGMDTAAVYRAWDTMSRAGSLPPEGTWGNDLEAPALRVEPRLALWRQAFAAATGVEPRLAGSGSTWFVEGGPDSFGLEDRRSLQLGRSSARLLRARTVPAI
ncbi:MAG TPA: 4-(cytidine 5'-diphospho)-2-C-methyl-D-erythritol kinase [Acidimicrobiales bacterium]|nr:4-(cytidine 5'-diphospho)-2-C-methyl-D-erythritol kinase [Acidimicrobiales bacterium]